MQPIPQSWQIASLVQLRDRWPVDEPRGLALLNAGLADSTATMRLRLEPSPLQSALGNAMLADAEAGRLRDWVAKSKPILDNLVASRRARDDATRNTSGGLTADAFAPEVRQVFRGLDVAGKNAYLADAVRRGDAPTIAALVTVPVAVSGMTLQEQDLWRETFLNSKTGKGAGRIADEMANIVNTSAELWNAIGTPGPAAVQTSRFGDATQSAQFSMDGTRAAA
jgi:hypothetical protein